MAKILITLWQNDIFDNSTKNLFCYYESLVKELIKFGNQVFVVNKRFIAQDFWVPDIKYKGDLINQVKKFDPDLIIAFNNQIFDGLLENTHCPVALFDADGILMFSCRDMIKKYSNRYYMISSYKNWESDYENIGILKNRVFNIHTATAIHTEKKEKNTNISFIGSKFDNKLSLNIKNYIKNSNLNIYSMKKEYWENNIYDYEMLLKKHCPDLDCSMFDAYNIFDNRNYILTSVLDLGLKLYGKNWLSLNDTNIDLMSAYDKTPVYSLKQNQDVYNSSKVNLSISHPQCKGYAYPWRCYDIMASSGLLICSYSKLLKDLTKKYVKIPMYQSPYEARELCKYALSNPSWCEDIILASNDFIEKYGRWEDNFKILENIFNINLINCSINKEDEIVFYNPKQNVLEQKNISFSVKFKNIKYGIFLILMHLPILENFFSTKFKTKIYGSIEKYRNKVIND